MELLYKACRHKFIKEKKNKIEDTIDRLKEIKERDFSDKILREIKNQLIQLSYNCRNTVLSTWENKTEGKQNIDKIEEDSKDLTDKEIEEFQNMFIEVGSEYDNHTNSESEDFAISI